ncbi:MAG: GFA family protein [Myxococcaceae bacterium]
MGFPLEGGCSCGEVRYRLTTEPMIVHCCHCTLCQRQTGSAFVINALIESSRVELLGKEPVAVSMPTESGRPHDIYRCAKCEIAVWSDYGKRPYLRFMRVATLDTPHAIQPDVHIFFRSKVPWVRVPDDAKTFAEFYEIEKTWPPASLARRAALMPKA